MLALTSANDLARTQGAEKQGWLELPALGFHKLLERKTGHTEVLAEIWNFGSVGTQPLKCYDAPFFNSRARDDEGISVSPTL
jgi:hypothetical protein